MIKFFLSAFLLLLIFYSCSPEKKRTVILSEPVQQVTITRTTDSSLSIGTIQKVICDKDTLLSYSLYLPRSFSAVSNKAYPVIYFFDPHGEGALPIEKYKDLADKYDFILAASNNSKNGLEPDKNARIVNALFEDSQRKLLIDNKRIYTAGFSGGARVAGSIAISNKNICGLIACGAGFSAGNRHFKEHRFDFVGISGDGDFNLVELKNLDRSLAGSSIKHQLLIFEGKHEWPPVEFMDKAFLFLQITAIKKGLSAHDNSLIQQFIHEQEKEISTHKKKKHFIELWNLYRALSDNLYMLADVEKYKEEIILLEQSPGFLTALKKEMDAEKSELEQQQFYARSLSSENLEWWKNEIVKMKSSDGAYSVRMQGYLGLLAYMFSSDALKKDLYPQAEHYLTLYALLEPGNCEHHYMNAQLCMKLKQTEKALDYLNNAIECGFKDKVRLENDLLFYPLQNNPAFKRISSFLKE